MLLLLTAALVLGAGTETVAQETNAKTNATAQPEHEAEKPLGQTVDLRFQLLPPENPEQNEAMSISVATRKYTVEMMMTGDGFRYQFAADGEIQPVKGKPDTFLLLFGTHIEYETEGSEFSFSGHGSVLVKLGKTTRLAAMGDKALVVTVTTADKQ